MSGAPGVEAGDDQIIYHFDDSERRLVRSTP
jgi:hypothetical protein